MEKEHLDSLDKMFQCDHDTQSNHLHPGLNTVAGMVFRPELIAIAFDDVQYALKAGAIPDSGQFAA